MISRIALLVVLAISLGVGGCGKKGPPRAPELTSPEVIRNLRVQSTADGIALTWGRPAQYIDGKELTDLTSFVIFRKEIPANCPECVVPYRPLTTVLVEDRERFIKQKQYRFVDTDVRPQAVYRYRVSSQLVDGTLGGPSNEVEIKRGP